MLSVSVCDSCSVFLYDMRLNQLVAKVFNGDVIEGDSRPVSEMRSYSIMRFYVNHCNLPRFYTFIHMLLNAVGMSSAHSVSLRNSTQLPSVSWCG